MEVASGLEMRQRKISSLMGEISSWRDFKRQRVDNVERWRENRELEMGKKMASVPWSSFEKWRDVNRINPAGVQTCCTNSGLRKEKPKNSFWSKFIMNSLSVGVRSSFSDVNCLSKLLTSLRCFCSERNKKDRILVWLRQTITTARPTHTHSPEPGPPVQFQGSSGMNNVFIGIRIHWNSNWFLSRELKMKAKYLMES